MVKRKGNIGIIIVLLIAVLAVILGGGYFVINNLSPTITPTQVPTTNKAKESTYSNSTYKFTFNYPQNWNCNDSDKNSGGYSLSIFCESLPSKPNTERPFEGFKIKENWSTEKELAQYKKSNTSTVYPEISNLSNFVSGSTNGKKFTITYPIGLTVQEVIFEKDGNLFVLVYTEKNKNEFDQILSTFKFIEKKETVPTVCSENQYGSPIGDIYECKDFNVLWYAGPPLDAPIIITDKNWKQIMQCGGMPGPTGESSCPKKYSTDNNCIKTSCPNKELPTCGGKGFLVTSENSTDCCSGLTKIPNIFIDSKTNTCQISDGTNFICSACGNNICNPEENKCNCPQDCK